MKTQKPKWHHWLFLTICGLWLLTNGLLDIAYGAYPDSRYYVVDDIVVRVLGIGSVLSAVGVALRRNWGFLGGIWTLALQILETLVSPTASLHLVTRLVVAAILGGVPILLLARLRAVIVPRAK